MEKAAKGYWLRRSGMMTFFILFLFITEFFGMLAYQLIEYLILYFGIGDSFLIVLVFPLALFNAVLPFIVFFVALKITKYFIRKYPIENLIRTASSPIFILIIFAAFFASPLIALGIVPENIAETFLLTNLFGLIVLLVEFFLSFVWIIAYPTFIFLAIRERKMASPSLVHN